MNNNEPRLEKMPNPKQSPEKTGDGIAMVIVVILLIAIIANSPNTNKATTKNNNSIPDGTAYVDTVQKQEKFTDTSLIEHHANPIDSLVREMFYLKNR